MEWVELDMGPVYKARLILDGPYQQKDETVNTELDPIALIIDDKGIFIVIPYETDLATKTMKCYFSLLDTVRMERYVRCCKYTSVCLFHYDILARRWYQRRRKPIDKAASPCEVKVASTTFGMYPGAIVYIDAYSVTRC